MLMIGSDVVCDDAVDNPGAGTMKWRAAMYDPQMPDAQLSVEAWVLTKKKKTTPLYTQLVAYQTKFGTKPTTAIPVQVTGTRYKEQLSITAVTDFCG